MRPELEEGHSGEAPGPPAGRAEQAAARRASGDPGGASGAAGVPHDHASAAARDDGHDIDDPMALRALNADPGDPNPGDTDPLQSIASSESTLRRDDSGELQDASGATGSAVGAREDPGPRGPACELPLLTNGGDAGDALADASSVPGSGAPGSAEGTVAEPDAPEVAAPAIPDIVDVMGLDWDAIAAAVDPGAVRARMRDTVERMEALLDRSGGPRFLFDGDRQSADDRAIAVSGLDEETPLWFIGDLHGDLLALEAALALMKAEHTRARPRLVFLGDLIDDGGYGLEVLLRIYELLVEDPARVCLVAGNHDEALGYDGARFSATVSPSDFTEFLNARLAHEWVARAGKLAVRVFADAPRALFFPDGLLVAHGGFPLTDLHAELLAAGNWNDPRCLTDFVWTRAHPKARKKMPNRTSRGSQFGYEDFAAFCSVAEELGRPVTHMVRGHDHVDDRWAIHPAYAAHPILTTNALSRQLDRESFGPFERIPTIARWVPGAVPQVHRLHVPGALVREIFAETAGSGDRR